MVRSRLPLRRFFSLRARLDPDSIRGLALRNIPTRRLRLRRRSSGSLLPHLLHHVRPSLPISDPNKLTPTRYMSILTYSPAARIDHDLTLSHFIFATITPAGNLLRSMLLALNEFSLLCRDKEVVSYPGSLTVYGGPILYLLVQSALLFLVLVWYDSGYKPPFLAKSSRHLISHAEETVPIPADVLAETKRTEEGNDPLRVLHLSKSFAHTPAVSDLTFGIPTGAVFALLGPNGAGKVRLPSLFLSLPSSSPISLLIRAQSTTIALIRGDVRPSHNGGDVLIESKSITAHRAAARGSLGVCPQFDAMDTMTTAEHLSFYARARGVADVATNVAAVMAAVGLTPFAGRLANTLSGGNKRKLSLAIALMGNPSVLLLDEPSSGMDAAAKRVMWKTLLGVAAPGRSLLITTHSMEEADKLASNIGIMKERMLAVGSSAGLRGRWGDAWLVHLVLRSAPATGREEMARVMQWVRREVRGAELPDVDVRVVKGEEGDGGDGRRRGRGREEWGGCGQLRFRVVRSSFSSSTREKGGVKEIIEPAVERKENGTSGDGAGGIAGLFALLEANKEELGFEYYSISPTTLDQVFLRIVGAEEQDEGKEKRRGAAKKSFRFWRR